MNELLYCLGDSNTYGYDPRSPFGDPYDRPFPALLNQLPGITAVSDGICGRTIRDALLTWEDIARGLRKTKPTRLLILLGTNDILLDNRTAEETAARIEKLLQKIRQDFPRLPVVLASPPWIRIPLPEACSALEDLSRQLKDLVSAGDFLDLYSLSLPLSQDGVHLSEEGHKAAAEAIYRHLLRVQKEQ